MFLAAFVPFICLFTLIFVFKKSVLKSIIISLLFLLIIGIFLWGIDALRIVSAAAKGFFVATEIMLIIFGAILILEILKKNNLFASLRIFFNGISKDRRVQAILIGLALVSFIEGAAGFGTPAALAAPLLVALGFSPMLSVALALVGDSVPVVFGAVGLPVTYGIFSALGNITDGSVILSEIVKLISSLNIIGYIIIPLFLTSMVVWSHKGKLKDFLEFIPFALISGLSISIPAFLTATYVGPELPSLVGGFVGLIVISLSAKFGIFLPKNIFVFAEDKMAKAEIAANETKYGILKALLLYAIVIFSFVISRVPFLPVKNILLNFGVLHLKNIFGYAINYSFAPFYSSGIIFIFVAIISAVILKTKLVDDIAAVKATAKKMSLAYVTLIAVLVFVQILVYSGENAGGISSIPIVLADGAARAFGIFWPVVSPIVGAFGAFIAGSATVSNLLFSDFQYSTAQATGFSPILILSLQGIGAAAGNMIALHNIIAALAVVGIIGKEKEVIKANIVPLAIYLLIIGVIGFVFLA